MSTNIMGSGFFLFLKNIFGFLIPLGNLISWKTTDFLPSKIYIYPTFEPQFQEILELSSKAHGS